MKYLSKKKKIEVYVFVPIYRDAKSCTFYLADVGYEWQRNASFSFLRFTAHEFKKHLKLRDAKLLEIFKVDAVNEDFEFWERDCFVFELIKK